MKKISLFFLILIFILSLFFHFYRLSFPSQVVFDEQWYASSAASYFNHKYYFDTHPPLAKLLIAFSGYLFGFNDPTGNFYFRHATEYPSVNSYLPFRILPAFLGSLIPILGWFLVKGLNGSDKSAFLASAFLLFDNALLTQSRFVLIEIFLVFFSLLVVLFFIYFVKEKPFSKKWYVFLTLIGIFLGCAISVKWSAFALYLTLIFLLFLKVLKGLKLKKKNFLLIIKNLFARKDKQKEILILFFFIFILPFLIYIISFYIHFSLLKIPRDIKDLSDPFLYSKKEDTTKTPSSFSYEIPTGNFIDKFIMTNRAMLSVASIKTPHPYQSKWYEWPFSRKPMLYFLKDKKNIYLIGNSVVWGLSLVGVVFIFFIPYFTKKTGAKIPYFFKEASILYFYFSCWLFYAGLSRTSFLYYYLFPFCLSVVVFALIFDFIFQRTSPKIKNIFFVSFLVLAFLGFIFYLPFNYGISLSGKEISLKFLLLPIPYIK